MKEALLYKVLENKQVACQLCAHACRIPEGKFGFCLVRQNIGGVLYTHSYGKVISAQVDPVEKKPLYHFLPGSSAFSIASPGCNFRCGFCQNWEISQFNYALCAKTGLALGEDCRPDDVVRLARENNCQSIAYTYTEPTIYFEFALETARLAKASGLYNIFVSNGYMSKEAILMIQPYLDAANIDLKFFDDNSYQKICAGHLAPVLESIRLLHAAGIWVEITSLIIPGQNDTAEELKKIAEFIAGVSKDIPWHVSRFHADYKFSGYPATPEKTLKTAWDLGKKAGLRYIYAGNLDSWGQDTLCPACKKVLIKRKGFTIADKHLLGQLCGYCRAEVSGIFDPKH